MTPPSDAPRSRDAAATRAALLAAARRLFARASYSQVTTKAVGAEAGADAALVNRYFGTKAALFAEAVGLGDPAASARLDAVLAAETAALPLALARYLAEKTLCRPAGVGDDPGGALGYDPVGILLRSVSDPEGGPLLRAVLEDGLVGRLAERLAAAGQSAADAERRARTAAALVLGYALSVVVAGPLDDRAEAFTRELSQALAAALGLSGTPERPA